MNNKKSIMLIRFPKDINELSEKLLKVKELYSDYDIYTIVIPRKFIDANINRSHLELIEEIIGENLKYLFENREDFNDILQNMHDDIFSLSESVEEIICLENTPIDVNGKVPFDINPNKIKII